MADYDILGARKRQTADGPITYEEVLEQQRKKSVRAGTLTRDGSAADLAAQRRNARETNAPVTAAEALPQQAAEAARVRRALELLKGNPRLTRTLSDPYKSTISENDYDEIIRTNKALQKKKKATDEGFLARVFTPGLRTLVDPFGEDVWSDFYRDTKNNITKGVDLLKAGRFGTYEGFVGATIALAENLSEVRQSVGLGPLPGLADARKGASISGKVLGEKTASFIPEDAGIVERGVKQGFLSAHPSLTALVVGRGSPLGSAAVGGTIAGGQSFGEARAQGLSVEEATNFAGRDAAIEIVSELPGLRILLGRTKVGSTLGKKIKDFVVTDQIGEQFATHGQDLNAWATLPENEDKTFGDYLKERPEAAVETMIATAIGGGIQQGSVLGVQGAIKAASKVAAGRGDAEVLSEVMDSAANHEMRNLDPVAFQEYMEDQTNGTSAENVYISAEAIDRLRKEEVLSSSEGALFQELNDQIEEGLTTGGDVVIPLARLAAAMDESSHWDRLSEDARLDPDGFTPRQLAEREASAPQDFETAADQIFSQAIDAAEANAPREAVYTKYKDQLTAAGFTESTADVQATLLADARAAMGASLGMTAVEYDNANPIDIQRVGLTPAEGGANKVLDQGSEIRLRKDNPGGGWLEGKQRKERADKAEGRPGRGTPTGYLNQSVKLPVSLLATARGANSEQRVPGEFQYDALLASVEAEGFRDDSPILVHVDADGEAYVLEGNTRIAVAQAKGVESIPVEIRWTGGSEELTANGWSPNEVLSAAQTYERPDARTLEQEPLTSDEVRLKAEKVAANVPGMSSMLPYLADDEIDNLQKRSAEKMMQLFRDMPTADEMASVAFAGRAKRGWYERSAAALVDIFGVQDATRFAALLAALSPQTSVESNAINALQTWINWDARKRPTDKKAILKILGDSVQGGKGVGSVLNAWINNSMRALQTENVTEIVLSGPKVNSFWLNLIGVLDEVTNDTWMANYALMDQGLMDQGLMAKGGGKALPGKSPGYKAFSAAVRRSADILSNRTGDHWTPAEVQETVWSWVKALTEKRFGSGEITAEQLLEIGGLTHEDIGATPDFAQLFTRGVYRRILETGGYSAEIFALERSGRAAQAPIPEGEITDAEGSGVDTDTYRRHLNEAAARIDFRYTARYGPAARNRQMDMFEVDPIADRFSPATIGDLLQHGDWAVLTAENPEGKKQSKKLNALAMRALKADLQAMGLEYAEAVGKYGQIKNSFVIAGITQAEADMLGRKYQQDSVLTNQGLVYRDGSVNPVTGDVEVFDERPKDFFTEIPALGTKFAIGINFDQKIRASGGKGLDASWSPARADKLIASNDGKNYMVRMSPDEFLGLTLAKEGRARVEEVVMSEKYNNGELDVETLAGAGAISLRVIDGGEPSAYQLKHGGTPANRVMGHDGRHRATLLKMAGVKSMPVLLNYPEGQPAAGTVVSPQRSRNSPLESGDTPVSLGDTPVSLGEPIALTEENRDRLSKENANILFQGKNKARGQVAFFDEKSVITLFEDADMSTLLHETGHVFVEEMARNAQRPEASDALKADWETVKAWLKKNGHEVEGTTIPREAHELLARGFERYLMEGRAPSKNLEGAFSRFRAWLTAVYKTVQKLRSPVTPEIREVFDRLLATQEAIDEYRSVQSAEPLFTEKPDDMTAEEFNEYTESVKLSKDEANAQLLKQVMENIRKRESQKYRDRRKAVTEQIRDEVTQEPRFVVLELLRTGKWINEPDRPPVGLKLDRDWVVERYGDEGLNSLPKGAPLVKRGGDDAEYIAEAAGFRSSEDMMEALFEIEVDQANARASGARGSVMDREIKDQVTAALENEGADDALNNGDIEEEARAAIENEQQADVLNREIHYLARGAKAKPTPYALARAWASRRIGAGKVQDVASRAAMQQHARAAAKSGREAEKALVEGNGAEAYRHKQAQIINHALFMEAKAANEKVDKIIRRMKRLAKRKAMKSVDQDYFDRVHTLLEGYDFRPRSQKFFAERDSFLIWAATQAENGFEVVIPARLSLEGEHYTRIRLDELYGLDDAVASLMELGRRYQKIQDGIEERNIAQLETEMLAKLAALPSKHKKTDINQKPRVVASLMAPLLKIETMSDDMDGYDSNGPFNRLLVHRASDAENLRAYLRDLVMKPVTERYMAMDKKHRKRLEEKLTIPEFAHRGSELDPRNGQPVVMTRMELLSIALNTGNASNLEKMSKGEGWPAESILRVLDREMKKEDWDFVQGVWDSLELLWPHIAASERRISGVVPERVEVLPISTKFGEYRGGYYPVVYDPSRAQFAEDNAASEADDLFGMSSGIATPKGHTITRTGAVGPIVRSIEMVLFGHIEKVITRIAYAEYARDVLRMIKRPRIRAAMDLKFGQEYRKQIKPWLQRSINSSYADTGGLMWWDRFLKNIRINTTLVAMGFRVSTGVAQVSGLNNSIGKIGPANMARGIKRMLKERGDAIEFIESRSPEMARRQNQVNREMADAIRELRGKNGAVNKARAMAFWHIGMIDRYVVAMPTWLGAHEMGIEEGMTDVQASRFADKAVRQSQGSGAEKDMANWQSPPQETLRWLTLFYTFFNVHLNGQWEAVRSAKKGNMKRAAMLTVWFMIAAPLADALMSGDIPDEDDDDDTWALWFGRNVFFHMFSGAPILRDAAAYGERKMQDEYATLGSSPVIRALEVADRVAKLGAKAAAGEELPANTVKTMIEAPGYFLGLPTGQAGATGQFLWDYTTGEADPESLNDWYWGLSKGKVPEE